MYPQSRAVDCVGWVGVRSRGNGCERMIAWLVFAFSRLADAVGGTAVAVVVLVLVAAVVAWLVVRRRRKAPGR